MEPNKEVISGNGKIAEFMGLKVLPAGYVSRNLEYGEVQIDSLRYHRDWNDLMAVVEKIERLTKHWTDITLWDGRQRFLIYGYDGMNDLEVCGTTKIEATYNGVVKYIDYYNTLSPDSKTTKL